MARDWFDYLDKLAVPVALTIVGLAYTAHKDAAETDRAAAERVATQARLDLDRDTGYVKLLASQNDRERDLGLKIIDALSREHKFSPDLIPVVSALAAGRPSDPTTQTASHILAANPAPVTAVRGEAPSDKSVVAPVPVYIQIAREDQRPAARVLQDTLRAKGFATPGIELVPNGTANTYVRFFSRPNEAVSATVRDVMNTSGYSATTQDFVNPKKPLTAIEVWIGSKAEVNAG